MNSRELILAHLDGRAVDRLPSMPITMQLAADQIGANYSDYAADHRILVEAQLRTVENWNIDYVSAISDPAREAADCGADIAFFDNQPPAIEEGNALLADTTRLTKLAIPDPHGGGRMTDRIRALELFKQKVGDDKLIEGWIEGPIAEAADLRGINTIMMDFFDDPAFITDLLDFTTELGIRFARAQVEAGADLVGIGDAAASLLGPDIYNEHIWPRQKHVIAEIRRMGAKTRLHICGNTNSILEPMGRLAADIIDLDYFVDMDRARAAMQPGQVLLGNIDPVAVLCHGTPDQITAALAECHRAVGPAWIVGAGCEVPRETPPENMRTLCDYPLSHKP